MGSERAPRRPPRGWLSEDQFVRSGTREDPRGGPHGRLVGKGLGRRSAGEECWNNFEIMPEAVGRNGCAQRRDAIAGETLAMSEGARGLVVLRQGCVPVEGVTPGRRVVLHVDSGPWRGWYACRVVDTYSMGCYVQHESDGFTEHVPWNCLNAGKYRMELLPDGEHSGAKDRAEADENPETISVEEGRRELRALQSILGRLEIPKGYRPRSGDYWVPVRPG